MPNKMQPSPLATLHSPLYLAGVNAGYQLTKLTTLFLLLIFSVSVSALPEDRNQAIDVVAGNATIDDESGITVLTQDVKVQQGSMNINADKLVIYRDKKGDIDKMIATGKPAHFNQQQEKDQPLTKAWGSKMVYSVLKQTVTITGQARVEQLSDVFSGEKVIYHMDKAIVEAIGGKQRVKMVIQPKGKK